MKSPSRSPLGRLTAAWSILGVGLLFALAVARLGSRGIDTVQAGLGPGEWILLIALVLLFVVGEGWAALQRKWVPRVVDRARALRGEAPVSHRLLAPLYGMCLIGCDARRRTRAWLGVAAVVAAVLAVRALPDPWRGMIDLSVASALVWGLGALLVAGRRVLD